VMCFIQLDSTFPTLGPVGDAGNESSNSNCGGVHKCARLVLCLQLVSIPNVPQQMPDAVDVVVNKWEGHDGLGREHDDRGQLQGLHSLDVGGEVPRRQEQPQGYPIQSYAHANAGHPVCERCNHGQVRFVNSPGRARTFELLIFLPEIFHLLLGM